MYSFRVCGRFGWPSGNIARLKASGGPRAAVLRGGLQLADELFLGLVELRTLQRRACAIPRPSCSMINGKSFLRHFARISRDCTPTVKLISAPTLSNFSAIANLSSALVPRSSIIPDKRGNRDVARFRHGIARRQHAQNDDHILDIAAISDQIDSVDLRSMRLIRHVRGRGAQRSRQQRRSSRYVAKVGSHEPFSAFGATGTNQPVVL